MKKVAFATYDKFPTLTDDDRALIHPLRQRGIDSLPLIWDRPEDWQRDDLDMVVVRSCWNYHYKSREFLQWAKHIESTRIAIWNPAAVIEWNHDKNYLQEVVAQGIPVAPTVWLQKNETASLAQILSDREWERAVVKPTISATAFRTWLTSLAEANKQQKELDTMLKNSGVLIQLLLPEVQSKGEWSFFFFNQEFSHAVMKKARAGEFRVQEEYGGITTAADPGADLLRQAEQIYGAIHLDLLYARLDAVEIDGRLVLMELELIEPSLYLNCDPNAAERFADAIALRIS